MRVAFNPLSQIVFIAKALAALENPRRRLFAKLHKMDFEDCEETDMPSPTMFSDEGHNARLSYREVCVAPDLLHIRRQGPAARMSTPLV